VVPVSTLVEFPAESLVEGSPLHEFVWLSLSRLLGTSGGQRNIAYELSAALAWMASIPYCRDDDTLVEPILPDLNVRLRNGPTALKRHGWTPADLDRWWKEAEATRRLHARLPFDVVEALVPTELWPVIGFLFRAGAVETHARLESALESYALQPAQTGRRIGEPVGGGRLESLNTGMRALMTVWQTLSTGSIVLDGPLHEALRDWRTLPDRIDAAAKSRAENGGVVPVPVPSELLLRRALARLKALADLRYRKNGNLREGALTFKPFRDYALFSIFVISGSRKSAIFRRPDGPVLVEDYHPEHSFEGTDYVGPALRIRPARKGSRRGKKGIRRSRLPQIMWLPLPPEAARSLEIYLEIVGTRWLPNAPLWISEWLDRDQRIPNLEKPLDAPAFSYMVDKMLAADVVKGGGRFTPHSIRAAIEPLAADVGQSLKQRQLELPPPLPRITRIERGDLNGQVFADAITGHVFRDDPNGYKRREQNRERFALMVGFGIWGRLTGNEGAELGPDLERRAQADERLSDLRLKAEAADDERRRINEGLAATTNQAGKRLSAARFQKLRAERWRLEDALRLVDASIVTIGKEIEAAKAEATAAYAARIPLPTDWLPDRAPDAPIRLDEAACRTGLTIQYLRYVVSKKKLHAWRSGRYFMTTIESLVKAGLLREQPGAAADAGEPETVASHHPEPTLDVPLGARLPLGLAANVFNRSNDTIKRWALGRMPYPAGDPRNPWQPNSDPSRSPDCIEGDPGARRKWLIVTPELYQWLHRNPVIRERFALGLAGRL